jgi:hypothetical protein
MAVMWWDDMNARLAAGELASARKDVELASLRLQLEYAQSEARGLRAAAIEDVKDNAAELLELKLRHRQQLEAQALRHGEELAAAVAAAREAERHQLQTTVVPVLREMERQQAAVQEELVATRALAWECMSDPAAFIHRFAS